MSKEEKYTPIESEACLTIERHFWDEALLSPVYKHWAPFSSKSNIFQGQPTSEVEWGRFIDICHQFQLWSKKMAIILPTGQWYAPSAVFNVPWYCMVLHGIAWYCMVLHCIAWYYMILHGIACHCIVLHGIAWYCMVLHCIAWYCMVLHGIAWYCIVLHGIAWYFMIFHA